MDGTNNEQVGRGMGGSQPGKGSSQPGKGDLVHPQATNKPQTFPTSSLPQTSNEGATLSLSLPVESTSTHSDPFFFFPFPHLAEQVTPLSSIKLFYLTPATCSAWIFPFGAQKPGSSDLRLHQHCKHLW
jgi:hypothetical protein